MVESGEDELTLRSSVCDAMGRIAVGVGAQEFSPYVMPLLVASEKALHLGNPRLRETTFILWSQLATVYEGDLGESLAGIFKGLFDSLEQEEEEVELDLPEDQDGLVDEEVVMHGKKLTKKVKETVLLNSVTLSLSQGEILAYHEFFYRSLITY